MAKTTVHPYEKAMEIIWNNPAPKPFNNFFDPKRKKAWEMALERAEKEGLYETVPLRDELGNYPRAAIVRQWEDEFYLTLGESHA
jgi:hypothetical protein